MREQAFLAYVFVFTLAVIAAVLAVWLFIRRITPEDGLVVISKKAEAEAAVAAALLRYRNGEPDHTRCPACKRPVSLTRLPASGLMKSSCTCGLCDATYRMGQDAV